MIHAHLRRTSRVPVRRKAVPPVRCQHDCADTKPVRELSMCEACYRTICNECRRQGCMYNNRPIRGEGGSDDSAT